MFNKLVYLSNKGIAFNRLESKGAFSFLKGKGTLDCLNSFKVFIDLFFKNKKKDVSNKPIK